MASKKRVLFLIGGKSEEHEISLISSKHILEALDKLKFEPLVVVIDKGGAMFHVSVEDVMKTPRNPREVKTPKGELISIQPFSAAGSKPKILVGGRSYEFDVAFPVLHGPGGEDGSIQGLFEFSGVPVVGCDVKSSAICMDKGVTKRLCALANLPVAAFEEIYKTDDYKKYQPTNFPLFVKPARLGSSIGVFKVKSQAELTHALTEAFKLDEKVLVEDAVVGREIEVAILGNRGDLTVSPAGEIRIKTEFYSYDAKYVLEDAAELIYPAPLPPEQLKQLQALAVGVFNALECSGMARLDFFLRQSDGQFLLNEVNTIPGFTPISMYPKLMQLAGVGYSELITRLINLASR